MIATGAGELRPAFGISPGLQQVAGPRNQWLGQKVNRKEKSVTTFDLFSSWGTTSTCGRTRMSTSVRMIRGHDKLLVRAPSERSALSMLR